MIRIIITIIITIHGLIHLIGFARGFNLSQQPIMRGNTLAPLSGNSSKVAGILWVLTCAMFMVSGFSYYFRKDWFWFVAGAALLLSQVMIVIYWHDARWGTLGNIIVLIVVTLACAQITFKRSVLKDVNELQKASTGSNTIDSAAINRLPPIIQRWMKQSGVTEKPIPKVVRVLQSGSMRTEPSGNWMAFDAEQYVTIEPPGFVWNANIHTGAFIDIAGRDKYSNGKGNMLIKAASLIPIANSGGKEVDQGTMIRYIAEMIWYPQAATRHYVLWEQMSDNRARVTMTHGGISASGIYHFDEKGLPIAFEAQRWGEFKGKHSLENWFVSITDYGEMDGIQIGTKSEVTWKLKDGDFTWLRLVITDLKYE